MYKADTSNTIIRAMPETHLLATIKAIQANVGDGLNDQELTLLLQNSHLPTEAGFGFLGYCDRFVMLSVPAQDPADWYRDKGWVTKEKERIARTIAQKHGLTLYEPPDAEFIYVSSGSNAPQPHHHLEMSHNGETAIVVHPRYLKIRLYRITGTTMHVRHPQAPLALGPDLLQDLSALYDW